MKRNYLSYPLVDGYVQHWLVLGPCTLPVEEQPQKGESILAFRARVLKSFDNVTTDFAKPPMELDYIDCAKEKAFWEVQHCGDDHLLGTTCFSPVFARHRLWAFFRLSCPGAKSATIHLTTMCPASLWLNGRFVHRSEHLADADDQTLTTTFQISLRPGGNDVLVRLDQIAASAATLAMALRLDDAPLDSVRALVPTVTKEPERRIEWERAFTYTYMDRAVYTRDDDVVLLCSPDMPDWRNGVMRLQRPDGSIYAETFTDFKRDMKIGSLSAVTLQSAGYVAMMMPHPSAYYELQFRPRYSTPFWVSSQRFAIEPSGSPDDRLIELMQEAQRSNDQLYAELAKMSLGWWTVIDLPAIRAVLARIKRSESDAVGDLLGLLRMRVQFGRAKNFPAELAPEIDDCLTSFDYTVEGNPQTNFDLECNQILLYACQTLAGQTLVKETFKASGLTGRQERQRGEEHAAAWLKQHAQNGFVQWNTNIDLIVAALVCLADLSKSEAITEMATVLLDKVLFGLALDSFQGTLAASRWAAQPAYVRSGRFAPETALNRLLWGTGSHSNAFKGALHLGLAGKRYQPPELIRAIALAQLPDVWTRQRSRGSDGQEVNTVAYKTPDYVLASVQDYRPGQTGRREHIWQATLSPDALVYTTHPGNVSQDEHRNASWWCGNATLPRVAQWKDALIAVYSLPPDARLSFTHAHFPAYAFDEHMLDQGWAFARKGNAYLALFAAPGMEMVNKGHDANRELRAGGAQTVWLCQMGRAEVDGSFEEFRARVLATPPAIAGLSVEWTTARGERLAFGWTGPLTVNGEEQPITGFKHIESPFAIAELPAETMDIGYGEQIMRLHFT